MSRAAMRTTTPRPAAPVGRSLLTLSPNYATSKALDPSLRFLNTMRLDAATSSNNR